MHRKQQTRPNQVLRIAPRWTAATHPPRLVRHAHEHFLQAVKVPQHRLCHVMLGPKTALRDGEGMLQKCLSGVILVAAKTRGRWYSVGYICHWELLKINMDKQNCTVLCNPECEFRPMPA